MSTMSTRMTPVELRASVSLASIYALRMLGLFLILPVFAVHARNLPGGDDPSLVGLALGIYGLTQGLLQIPFGIASDRWGRKPVIVAGLVVFAVGSFIAASASDLTLTIVGRALQGAGAVSAAVTAFIADSTREAVRTKAMAMVGGSIGATFALSLVGAPVLYSAIGVAGLFALTGVLTVAAIGVVAWVVPAVPAAGSAPADVTRPPWTAVVLDPQLLRLNLGIFSLHAIQMAMFVVMPVMLVERGLPLPSHWTVYLPVVLVSFALMMPPIVAAERHGRLRHLLLAAVAALLAVQLGLAAWAPSLLWMAGWLLLFFLAFNLLEAVLPSMVSRMAPPASKGLALGVYNTTLAFGLFAGGAAGGWLARHGGPVSVFIFTAVASLLWLVVSLGLRTLPAARAAAAGA
jgi:MFS family permease